MLIIGNKAKRIKTYWAQNDKKYKSYFNNTDLFILYSFITRVVTFLIGGIIFLTHFQTDSELIIYNYNSNNESDSENN